MVPPPSSQRFQPRACKTCLTPPSPVIPSTSKSSPHILHNKQQLSTSTVPIASHTGSPASLCSCNSQLTGPRATPLEKVPKIVSLLLLKPQGLPTALANPQTQPWHRHDLGPTSGHSWLTGVFKDVFMQSFQIPQPGSLIAAENPTSGTQFMHNRYSVIHEHPWS